MKRFIFLTLFLLLAVGFIYEMIVSTGVDKIVDALSHISPWATILFIIVSIINFMIFTLRWKVILKTHNKNLPSLFTLSLYRLVSYTFSYLIPSGQVGGEPARILLLKRKGIPGNIATSSVILDKVFELSVTSGFSGLALILVLFNTKEINTTSIVAVLVIVSALGFFFYMSVFGEGFFTFFFRILHLEKIKILKKTEQHIIETEAHIKTFFLTHKIALLNTIILSLICFVMMMVEYYVVLVSMGIHANFTQLLVVTALPLIGYLIPSPGAIGSLELFQIAAFNIAGIDPTLALPTLIILRLRDILFLAVGVVVSYKYGFSLIKPKTPEKEQIIDI
ncbi:MAG: YbhN family protein [Candidatus Gracilibacteria bacterium]